MKKKLKDLTLKDINKLCKSMKNCYDCPFLSHCSDFSFCDNEVLEEEIEVEDE